MRQTEYRTGPLRQVPVRKRKLFRFSIALNAPFRLQALLARKTQEAHGELLRSARRSVLIRSSSFNLNFISEEECLSNFRFRRAEIGRIALLLGGPGLLIRQLSSRSRRSFNSIEATCIILRRLASPCRWSDLELMFGKRRRLYR